MSNAVAPRGDRVTEIEVAGGSIQLSPTIVRRYCVTGNPELLTDQEAYFAIARCRAYRLNPFIGEIHVIKYGKDDPAAFVIPKETFLKRAQRHPAYLGFKAGAVVMKGTGDELNLRYIEGSLVPPGWQLVGGWAEVHRSDQKFAVRVEVGLTEYVQTTRDGRPNRFWREKPATMIRKVALVQALREAFPEEFQGLFERDEVGVPEQARIEEVPASVTEEAHPVVQVSPEEPLAAAPVAAPLSAAVEAGGSPQPATPGESESPRPADPSPSKQVRLRRRREAVTPALFDGRTEMLTAGIRGGTLDLIYQRLNQTPESRAVVEAFLSRLALSTAHPTYLRQEEGEALLLELEQAFPAAEAGREPEPTSPAEPVAPEPLNDGMIPCPEDPGGSRVPLYCSERCRSRDHCESFGAWQGAMRKREAQAPYPDPPRRNLF